MGTEPRRIAGITTHRNPVVRHCPTCRARLDASTGTKMDATTCEAPEPGDFTLCGYCGTFLVFTETSFRLATQHDFDQLDPDLKRLVSEYRPRERRR